MPETPFNHKTDSAVIPAKQIIAVTLADTDQYYVFRQLYVGVGGDVKVRTLAGDVVTFVGVPQGATIGPFFVDRVYSTGTTATSLIGYV